MGKGFEGSNDLRVEYHPLSVLVRAPRNPKTHDRGALSQSFRRCGYIAPMVLNETTGRLVVGHGRLDALQQAKAAGQKPPARVKLGPKGEWLVPVIRGVAFKTDQEAEAYLIADNQHTLLGAWDDTQLSQVLADLAAQDALTGTGFDRDDVDALLRQVGGDELEEGPAPKLDQAKALQKKWNTARGQLWQIGKHRILCGDSTVLHDVARLTVGHPPAVMLTDPPYCSGGFQEAQRSAGSVGTDAEIKPVANDTLSTRGYMALLKCALTLGDTGAVYVFTDWRMWVPLFDVVESSGYGVRNMLVWDKGSPGMGIGWRTQHELVMFGMRARWGKFDNHKAQGNVLACRRTGNIHHTVEKPIQLLQTILAVTDFAPTVYDPFLGSGSTMVAADQERRVAYGMELDPAYVAVTLQRLADMGLTPKLVDG
mgnify:CR=1 FL=1